MGKLPTISRTTIARCATQKIKRSMNGKGLSPWFPRLARLHILPSIKELDEPKLIETHSEEYYIIKHCPYSRAKDCHSKQTKKVKNEDTRYTPNGIRRSKSLKSPREYKANKTDNNYSDYRFLGKTTAPESSPRTFLPPINQNKHIFDRMNLKSFEKPLVVDDPGSPTSSRSISDVNMDMDLNNGYQDGPKFESKLGLRTWPYTSLLSKDAQTVVTKWLQQRGNCKCDCEEFDHQVSKRNKHTPRSINDTCRTSPKGR